MKMRKILLGKIKGNQKLLAEINQAFSDFSRKYEKNFSGDILFFDDDFVMDDDKVEYENCENVIKIYVKNFAKSDVILQNLEWSIEE